MTAKWLLCLVMSALAPATAAQSRQQFGSGDPIVVDPRSSYIFYRTNISGANIRFLREYEPGESPGPVKGGDPMSERDRWVQVRHGPRLTGGREGKTYLRAVRPGSYILYGNVAVGNNGAHVGVCLCMGTLRFDAPAGQIVDLGTILFPDVGASKRPWGVSVVPFDSTMVVPSRLAGLPRVAAEFRAAPKLDNIFGVEIDRHDAMPGVLAYDRDLPIDVRTGRPAAPAR
ncbi:MAG TPA: hypothetical protein VEA61_11795 [Allosphingosinicella sp.]|nr:hypothetical protein [Allosphingosinicella sp.]